MKHSLKFLLPVCLFLCVFFTGYNQEISTVPTIEASNSAYRNLNLKQARTILLTLLTTDSLPVDQKQKSLCKMALWDWKYYRNYNGSKQWLDQAYSIATNDIQTWLLQSRIETESEHYTLALAPALHALKLARSKADKVKATTAYCKAIHDLSISNLRKNSPVRNELLIEADSMLLQIVNNEPGYSQPARLLFGIALINRDGPAALKAWQTYFHVISLNEVNDYLRSAAEIFDRILPGWNGTSLAHSDREQLIIALGHSGFYEYTSLVGSDFNRSPQESFDENSKVHDIFLYSKFLEDIKTETLEYYRQYAIGNDQQLQYQELLNDKEKTLWQSLSFVTDPKDDYSPGKFKSAARTHFGALGFKGISTGCDVFSLLIAHIVNMQKIKTIQYGYQAEVTYTEIDLTVTDGYAGWFREVAKTGGWASGNEIVQVRENYINLPNSAWELFTDTAQIKETHDFIRENLFNENPAKQLVGLSKKLHQDGLNEYYQLALKGSINPHELQLKFVQIIEQHNFDVDIKFHEGRHIIDAMYFTGQYRNWSSEEKEFRAKLSELAFSGCPKLTLYELVGDIGDSGHGKANKRILSVGIEWMQNHSNEIDGFSPDKPLISQLYLMTNDQIRECYRSADPLYDKEFTGLKASASEKIKGLLQKSEFEQIKSDINRIISNSKEYYFLEKEFEALADELISSKRIEDASGVLMVASELFPGSGEVFSYLGEVYRKMGNTDLAISNYEKSLSIDPDDERAQEGIKRFKKSGTDTIKEILTNSTFKNSEAEILKICANRQEYYFLEIEINSLGYQLLTDKRIEDAIGVFEINTRFFPKSGNAFDSLGEAFMISGDTPSAIKNYEKSLELNPGNTNAILMLKKLRKE